MRTFASTHAILSAARTASSFHCSILRRNTSKRPARCQHIGAYPVLVGDEKRGERDTMLASPIILYDYPRIAPESPGDLFDGTEIDEILTLRVMAMTDAEKSEMRQVDDFARRILERTESLGRRPLDENAWDEFAICIGSMTIFLRPRASRACPSGESA